MRRAECVTLTVQILIVQGTARSGGAKRASRLIVTLPLVQAAKAGGEGADRTQSFPIFSFHFLPVSLVRHPLSGCKVASFD